MNKNEKEFIALIVDFNLLTSRLCKKCKNVIFDSVVKIDPKNKIVFGEKEKIKYDFLVSTIPKNIFFKISDKKGIFESENITYVKLKKAAFDTKEFDFVYCLDKDMPHRFTDVNNKYIVAELIGSWTEEELKNKFGHLFLDFFVLKDAQLINTNDDKIDDVYFISRYGAWDRNWKLENVVEYAKKFGDKLCKKL